MNNNNLRSATFILVIILLLLVIFMPKGTNRAPITNQTEPQISRRIEKKFITFSNKYGKEINPPSGVAVRFEDVTVKYCVKNAAVEKCSTGTEDLSPAFSGLSANNLRLWVKAQNNEIGSLTIVYEYY